MILKGLILFVLIILIFVSIVVLLAFNFILKIMKRMRGIANGEIDEEEEYERQTARRQQRQYVFRGGSHRKAASGHQDPNAQGHTERRQSSTSEGEVIIDNRRPQERSRKIISEEEGEYVEFTEE